MNDQNTLTAKQLLISGVISLILAFAIVVFFVLPAEYGEDPTGFGNMTGLEKLSSTNAEQRVERPEPEVAKETEATSYIFIDPADAEISYDWMNNPEPALLGNNYQSQNLEFKTETIRIRLEKDSATEYKAIMNQGDTLVYSWKASSELYTDFHAHLPNGNPDFYTRYSEGRSSTGNGSIVAPYRGQHGWYWENAENTTVEIELNVAGHYDQIIEFDLSADAE